MLPARLPSQDLTPSIPQCSETAIAGGDEGCICQLQVAILHLRSIVVVSPPLSFMKLDTVQFSGLF